MPTITIKKLANQVFDTICTVTDEMREHIFVTSSLESVLADETDRAEITLILEGEFCIEIPEDVMQEWETIGDIIAYCEKAVADPDWHQMMELTVTRVTRSATEAEKEELRKAYELGEETVAPTETSPEPLMKSPAIAAQLAAWVRASAAAHENSFDKEACEQMRIEKEAEAEAAREANAPHAYLYGIFDTNQFYRLTLLQAVQSVTPADMVEPVYYLLRHTWNDMMYWCDSVEKPAEKPEA